MQSNTLHVPHINKIIAQRNNRLLSSLFNMAKFYKDNGRPVDALRVLKRYITLRNRLNVLHCPV